MKKVTVVGVVLKNNERKKFCKQECHIYAANDNGRTIGLGG